MKDSMVLGMIKIHCIHLRNFENINIKIGTIIEAVSKRSQ